MHRSFRACCGRQAHKRSTEGLRSARSAAPEVSSQHVLAAAASVCSQSGRASATRSPSVLPCAVWTRVVLLPLPRAGRQSMRAAAPAACGPSVPASCCRLQSACASVRASCCCLRRVLSVRACVLLSLPCAVCPSVVLLPVPCVPGCCCVGRLRSVRACCSVGRLRPVRARLGEAVIASCRLSVRAWCCLRSVRPVRARVRAAATSVHGLSVHAAASASCGRSVRACCCVGRVRSVRAFGAAVSAACGLSVRAAATSVR